MKTLATLVLVAFCSVPAVACDKVDAAKVQLVLSEMGTQWSEQSGRVTLHWGWEWDGAPHAQRLELLRTFASGDGCLSGQVREINFYRKGTLVGMAAPAVGVQLVSDTATAQANTRSVASPQDRAGCAN